MGEALAAIVRALVETVEDGNPGLTEFCYLVRCADYMDGYQLTCMTEH